MRSDHRPYSLDEKISPETTALIVVDMQNDFCHQQGHYGKSGPAGFNDLTGIEPIYDPMAGLIEAARRADVLRIFVKSHFDPKFMTPVSAERRLANESYGMACQSGTWGAEILDQFQSRPSERELEVVKHRYSAFRDTNLPVILHAAGIRSVVVTGVTTSVCVDSTARDAFANDYFVVVPSDTCADYTEEKHGVYLAQLGRLFSVVCPASELIERWTAPGFISAGAEAAAAR